MHVEYFHRAWRCVVALTLVAAAGPLFADEAAAWRARLDKDVRPLFAKRCFACHSNTKQEGEFNLEKFCNPERAADFGETWQRVEGRMKAGEMPPEDHEQFAPEEKQVVLDWIAGLPRPTNCNQIATDETQQWYRGYVMSRRLTRAEFNNSVRDLVGVELEAGRDLPADGGGGEGFDTVGDALFTSAVLMERYLQAAERVLEAVLPESAEKLSPEMLAAREKLLGSLPSEQLPEREAARQVVARFARRAYRRPPTEQEIERLLTLFDAQRKANKSYVAAVRHALKAVLISPSFLILVETTEQQNGLYRLNPHQLAARVAIFLWSSIPDDELAALADDGRLHETSVLRGQIRRMLADPKSRALAQNFGVQWLAIDRIGSTQQPDAKLFPEFSPELAGDLRNETIAFLHGIFREDRNLLELIDADYTYLNARLAAHYGLPAVDGNELQRVTLTDRRRGGVITMGSVLTATSYPTRTSPVLRGRWVMEEILGSRVPPPPPNVPALAEKHDSEKKLSLRERLEVHRKDASCASCHNRMDPLGFGLENFDAVGRWRTEDEGTPLDTTGKLPSGEEFSGPAELKQVLQKRKDEFLRHFVKKLYGYSIGRDLTKFDHCVIDETLKRLPQEGHRSSVLIEQIVLSYPFQHRYVKK